MGDETQIVDCAQKKKGMDLDALPLFAEPEPSDEHFIRSRMDLDAEALACNPVDGVCPIFDVELKDRVPCVPEPIGMCAVEGERLQEFFRVLTGESLSSESVREIMQTSRLDREAACVYIKKLVLDRIPELRDWRPVAILGQGNFGVVLLLRRSEREVAMKITFNQTTSWMTAVEENEIARQIAGRLGLAPVVYLEQPLPIGRKTAHITVQDRLDLNAFDYLQCLARASEPVALRMGQKFMLDMTVLFVTLARFGMSHMDLHARNVMLKFFPESEHFQPWLIDFGMFTCNSPYPLIDLTKFANSVLPTPLLGERMYYYFCTLAKLMHPDDDYWKSTQRTVLAPEFLSVMYEHMERELYPAGKMGCSKFNWNQVQMSPALKSEIYSTAFRLHTQTIARLNQAIVSAAQAL